MQKRKQNMHIAKYEDTQRKLFIRSYAVKKKPIMAGL